MAKPFLPCNIHKMKTRVENNYADYMFVRFSLPHTCCDENDNDDDK